MNLKNRQNLKLVLMILIFFTYNANSIKKKEFLKFAAHKEDKLYIDMQSIHDINAMMTNLHSNQEGITFPAIKKNIIKQQTIPDVSNFKAYGQTRKFWYFLEKDGRSVLQIRFVQYEGLEHDYPYFQFNNFLEENPQIVCEDLQVTHQYIVLLCNDNDSQELKIFIISSEANKLVSQHVINKQKFKNPRLSVISIQDIIVFKMFGIVYDQYTQDSEFAINEEFYYFEMKMNQSKDQQYRSNFKNVDIKFDIENRNIHQFLPVAQEERYQIQKVRFTFEDIKEIDDELQYLQYVIVYKVEKQQFTQQLYNIRNEKGDYEYKDNVKHVISDILCHQNFCFYVMKSKRFVFFDIMKGIIKQHIKLTEPTQLLKLFYFKDKFSIIVKQNDLFMCINCKIQTQQCQMFNFDIQNVEQIFQDTWNTENFEILNFNGTSVEQFQFEQSTLLEIDVSKLDTTKHVEIFQKKTKILTIDVQIYDKNKLYLKNNDNKILRKATLTKDFKILLPYELSLEDFNSTNKTAFDYISEAQIRNKHVNEQSDFSIHPIANNDIFTYLIQKQMRVYMIENFKFVAKKQKSQIDLVLLKSQYNYFQGYNIGSSRRIMGDKIDMSSFSKRGQNLMYDTFVYSPIEYATEFPESQIETCNYNQGFMVCVVKNDDDVGVDIVQIYTLEYGKKLLAYREIFNRSFQQQLTKYFRKFVDGNKMFFSIEKVLFYNDSPNKILIIARDLTKDSDDISIHEIDIENLLINAENEVQISFIQYLDFQGDFMSTSYFFNLHNHKLIVINRVGDIVIDVYDLKFKKKFQIPVTQSHFVQSFAYNHTKNLLVLAYQKEGGGELSIAIVRVNQDRQKQIVGIYHTQQKNKSPHISTYKIFDKYLLISLYDKYQGNLIKALVLNLKGAYIIANPKQQSLQIQNKQYPIQFESVEGFQTAELQILQKLKIDRTAFDQNNVIPISQLIKTEGNIDSYQITNVVKKGDMVKRLDYIDPFVENDLKSADAFEFSCNQCFIQDNILINKNNQNLQFTIQIIDLETKLQHDIQTKECDDFAYRNDKIFCFINELVGTSIYQHTIQESIQNISKKKPSQQTTSQKEDILDKSFRTTIQFQGKDYYYLEVGQTNQGEMELIAIVHQQQSQISFVVISGKQERKEITSFHHSFVITQNDFVDQQLFVNKLYMSYMEMNNSIKIVNVYVYDSLHNQIKIIDLQFQNDLENFLVDTVSFDLDQFEKDIYGVDCHNISSYNADCIIIGRVKVYVVSIMGQTNLIKNAIQWEITKQFEYYITMNFQNYYNYNPLSALSKNYFILANRTSYHSTQSVYIYNKNKESYVQYKLVLGQNCIVYEMKVIQVGEKEQLIVVFEYQGVGLQIKYYDITNQAFLKLDPNFDYLNDNYKFTFDINFTNGTKKTLDIEITDEEKLARHSAILQNRNKGQETSYVYAVFINTLGILMLIGIVVAIIIKEKKNREQLRKELEDNPLDVSPLDNQ